MEKKGDQGTRVWHVWDRDRCVAEKEGSKREMGTRQTAWDGMKEEEEGSGCVGVGHLGLGQTQMSGGFTVFSNYTADQFLVFAELGWEEQEREGKQRYQGLLAGQRAEGTRRSGSAGVRMWCVGVLKLLGLRGARKGRHG